MVKVVQFPSIEAEAVSYEVRWQVTWSGGRLPLLCGWEGNRRSGIALAMCHRLCGLSTYGLNGLSKGDEHPPMLREGYGTLLLLLLTVIFSYYTMHDEGNLDLGRSAAVCRSGYYQLRQAVRSLSEDASKTLVQAFVSCRLDYCKSLFLGISEGLMNRLQSVQNAAARLVTGTRCSDHISPVLRQLHWLPVRQRVDFKVATFVHQSLSGISPPYLADNCRLVGDACEWRLRSTASRTCVVTRTSPLATVRSELPAPEQSSIAPERR